MRLAASVLRAGGVIAHPTEAVFGLAASATNPQACARVAALKQRPTDKRFIVIAATVAELESLIRLDTPLRAEIVASWPGPNTWILPVHPSTPDWLRDHHGLLAVRVTAHPQTAALCRLAGPLVSTSANPAGRPPARETGAARHYFGRRVDLYLGGRTGRSTRPTTIRDGRSGVVVRA